MISIYESYYLEEGISDFLSKNFKSIRRKLNRIIGSTNSKIKKVEQNLRKNGIDPEKIRKYVYQQDIKVKNKKIVGFSDKLNKFVKDLYLKKFDDSTAEFGRKITVSVILLAVVFFINTLVFQTSIMMGADPIIAMAITSIFSAPIVEESAKMISVQEKATGTYFVIFNAAEFTMYVTQMVFAGVPLGISIISRLITVLVHYLLTLIHVEAKKKNKSLEGFGIAVILHALWNTMSVISIS